MKTFTYTKLLSIIQLYATLIIVIILRSCSTSALQQLIRHHHLHRHINVHQDQQLHPKPLLNKYAATINTAPLLHSSRTSNLENHDNITNNNSNTPAVAFIIEDSIAVWSEQERNDAIRALYKIGFQNVSFINSSQNSNDDFSSLSLSSSSSSCQYRYSKATGMLKLVNRESLMTTELDVPNWVPIVRGEENVLVSNGWSFLDPDESEPISSFDIDAANKEGTYVPKWNKSTSTTTDGDDFNSNEINLHLSTIGYDLHRISVEDVLNEQVGGSSSSSSSSLLTENAKHVLLEGGTDPRNIKITNNGYDFSGSISQNIVYNPNNEQGINQGIFVCAIGSLPLFTTKDLSPTTASSGWLSFINPIANDHVILVHPDENSLDKRVEVICARSRCHLGHYFGRGEGFCINASALNFIPLLNDNKSNDDDDDCESSNLQWNNKLNPISWRNLESLNEGNPLFCPSIQTLKSMLYKNVQTQNILFGAGCFWHIEFALRRLPGILSTKVGYAGGTLHSPSYAQVCEGKSGHAEVVSVTFDPSTINPRELIDCFLAMHDPTCVRAHGKRAKGSGQYRSCIFVGTEELRIIAQDALNDCKSQLGKELSTEIYELRQQESSLGHVFWSAESRHQRHDERVKEKSVDECNTLSLPDWLKEYGARSASVWGSSETIPVAADDFPVRKDTDDGMARFYI